MHQGKNELQSSIGEEIMAQRSKHSGRTLFALGLGYLVDQGESQSMMETRREELILAHQEAE